MQTWCPALHLHVITKFHYSETFYLSQILFQLLLDQSTEEDVTSDLKLLCCSGV